MSEPKSLRVLIAEDQALVRQGIVALLGEIATEIVEVGNGEDAHHSLKSAQFDLALLDIGLPRRTGLDVLREVKSRGEGPKVVILTGDTESYSPKQIYAAGADAFLYKTADASHFLETCIAVVRDEEPKNEDIYQQNGAGNLQSQEIASLRDQLSNRELQIVKLIVEGMSNRSAAEILFISEHTVRKHREHINQKLAIRSPLALASFAIKAGLV